MKSSCYPWTKPSKKVCFIIVFRNNWNLIDLLTSAQKEFDFWQKLLTILDGLKGQ
jgi:3-methyladenine DNA glycosylase AlkD